MSWEGLRRLCCFLVLGATVAMTAACAVGVDSGYSGYDGDYPPDAYIATTEPVYFEGRATYWYGGRWYYRDGGRWSHYDREPAGLYQRRVQAAPMRRNYESFHGSPGRAAPRTGGWRGGRH
jgi:hypothetical protein